MTKILEYDIEVLAIKFFQKLGYAYLPPEEHELEREGVSDVVLRGRLKSAVDRLNSDIPEDAREQALSFVLNMPGQNLLNNNEVFHRVLVDGYDAEVMGEDGVVGEKVFLVDFDNVDRNDFVVCNQFTVVEDGVRRRPDVVLFVNGLPLVVIELKNPAGEKDTVRKAFTQLQNYKNAIPSLFNYNAVLVASDGLDARAGTVSSEFSRFMAWRSSDGVVEDGVTVPQIETLIKGMFDKTVFLDLIRHFIVFDTSKKKDGDGLLSVVSDKKIAAYHQYYATNKAIDSTLRAVGMRPAMVSERPEKYGLGSVVGQPEGDGRAGVVWHTQGSGKSLSMVFYVGKAVLLLSNPTIVVMTDRNDLDDQLFDTFAGSKRLLRQEPVQAGSREELKSLLKVVSGGIVFTTIQKFFPEDGLEDYDLLSERRNIIVIADEAHRSQYGFKAKTVVKKDEVITTYGYAKYLREALPNASFIGFTGTPIETKDISTPAVFGNYIDVYDMNQSIKDGATVSIYYESRLIKVGIKPDSELSLDDDVDAVSEGEESFAKERAKAKWASFEAIVGNSERLRDVAKDIVEHFRSRCEVIEGKGMIVCMSRRIAVDLYEEIIKLNPDWHNKDLNKGALKVVMTSSSSDPENWQIHNTTKHERKTIGDRFKDETDELKLVIVRDMWLTGFDVPCLHTMYIDKPMRGHNLMQAIARVNRVFKDKKGGLIVDYIGIATDLKNAVSNYTASGAKGRPTIDKSDAVAILLEKYELIEQMLDKCDYKNYFTTDTREKLIIILSTQEHILGIKDGKSKFTKLVVQLEQAYSLSVPDVEALKIKAEVGFFQAVKARLIKYEPSGLGKSDVEIETAIRQIVDEAIVSEGVIDVFDAAGIKKPDISILSDEFLAEIQGMERKNLAVELLKKLLNDEVKLGMRRNLMQSRKFSEMLGKAINKYQNNLLTVAQFMEELINLAKDIRNSKDRGEGLSLSEDELAFYDALGDSKSAKDILGDVKLAAIAIEVFRSVKRNATIDWTLKESARAKLRRDVKRILNRYGYPPDQQMIATENVLEQAERMADELNV